MKNAFISWTTEDHRLLPLAELYQSSLTLILGDEVEFFISTDIEPGMKGIDEFHRQLQKSDFGIFFLSQRSASSSWMLYEYGALFPRLGEGRVFNLRCKTTIEQLKQVGAPFGSNQSVEVDSQEGFLGVVQGFCRALSFDTSKTRKTLAEAKLQFQKMKPEIDQILSYMPLFPDNYGGIAYFNSYITDSENYQMPQLFKNFNKELFLVGINHTFLLNLTSRKDILIELLNELALNPDKKVKILISNLWDEKIGYTYDKIVLGKGNVEIDSLKKVLFEQKSEYFLDKEVKLFAKGKFYEQHKKQLEIRMIDFLMDTFFFLDPQSQDASGKMMLLPMTASSGSERTVFYLSKRKNKLSFERYYNLCRSGFENFSTRIWPTN